MAASPSSTTGACATTQAALTLAGRLLMAWLFLPAGIGKLLGFGGTVGYIASAGLPLPTVAAVVALLVEIVGGAALIAGYKTRVVALVLAVFTLAASVAFHAYWAAPEAARMVPQLLFTKNMAVIGGLLILAAGGAGAWSLDGKRKAA